MQPVDLALVRPANEVASCGYGWILHEEDVRAGEVPHCLVQCLLRDTDIQLRVQSGPTGWVYTQVYPRTHVGYWDAWQEADHYLRLWWANNRDIETHRYPWESVQWGLRGLEGVLA